jgi:hypothetical protein
LQSAAIFQLHDSTSRRLRVAGELLLRATTGHVTLLRPERLVLPYVHPSMSLISKAFAPDSIFDGYKRVAALEQLGRDTVEAVIWPLNEVQALVLDRSLHWSERESALEEGWLLAELEQRFGFGLEELARQFDRQSDCFS